MFFVDDLDRCSPSQAVELIQSINLLIADELKLFFILAVDSKKIAAGIANKYKDDLPMLTEKGKDLSYSEMLHFGYEYLDKFIQVSLKMPSLQMNNIDEYFFHLVQDSVESNKAITTFFAHNMGEETPITIDFQDFAENAMSAISYMAAKVLQNNPRKLKKFFNLFKFYIFLGNQIGLFGLKEDSEHTKLTAPQLAKLLLLNYRWPKVLEICRIDPSFLTKLASWKSADIKGYDASTLFPTGYEHKSEFFLSLLQEALKNEELMTLIYYETEENPDWEMKHLNLSTFLEVSPTYTSVSEKAPSSMPA